MSLQVCVYDYYHGPTFPRERGKGAHPILFGCLHTRSSYNRNRKLSYCTCRGNSRGDFPFPFRRSHASILPHRPVIIPTVQHIQNITVCIEAHLSICKKSITPQHVCPGTQAHPHTYRGLWSNHNNLTNILWHHCAWTLRSLRHIRLSHAIKF